MKKEEPNPIDQQIRVLSKKYKQIGKDYIRIIHQFCQFDPKRTNKVLAINEEMKKLMVVINLLMKKPEKSEQIIGEIEVKYHKLFGEDVEEKMEEKQEGEGKEQIHKLEYQFFEAVPDDTLTKVMSFLDPYSFFKMSMTDKRFNKISLSEAQSEYYKQICSKLFTLEPIKFPLICRFIPIQQYVLQRPLQFRPNTRNAVNNNLRNYIWKMEMNEFQLGPAYYKSFGTYRNMFLKCPRVHMNGFYVLRDKYVRIGVKDERNPIAPIHVVYYYRYLRFLEDGTVLYHVRNKRLKPEQVMEFLSKQLLKPQSKRQNTMLGEYIQHKDKLYVKACQNREVFSYEFQINSVENDICNELKVMKYVLELIDDQQEIRQTLYAAHPLRQKLSFFYNRNQDVKLQNSPLMQSNGL